MEENTKIGLAGDWHGNERWMYAAMDRFHDVGITTILQAGDFGLWPGYEGEVYLNYVKQACADYGITLLVTPGNHENWDAIDDEEGVKQVLGSGEESGGWEVSLLPRGFKWEINGKTFLSFGGAPSIDRWMRRPGLSWWDGEMIKPEHIERLTRLDLSNGVDVMITHDTGDARLTDAVRKIVEVPYHLSGWEYRGLVYAEEGRLRLDEALAITNPGLLVHGHYHVPDQTTHEDGTKTVSLAADGMSGNLAVLDLDTMEVDFSIGILSN